MKKAAALLLVCGFVTALALLRPAPPPAVTPERPLPQAPRKPRQKAFARTPLADLPATEAQVKAAMLIQFLSHIPWPAPDPGKEGAPLLVGVLGISSVGDELHPVAGEKEIDRRRIRVLRGNDLGELPTCEILFIPFGWKDDWDLLLPAVRKPGVLVVGEEPGFLEAGGGIALRVEDQKIRFSMHLGNIRSGGLEVHPKLIDLANPLLR